MPKEIIKDKSVTLDPPGTPSSSSDEEFGQPSDSQSPSSMRLYLPKPRASIQRRFTLSGPPRPSAQSEQVSLHNFIHKEKKTRPLQGDLSNTFCNF